MNNILKLSAIALAFFLPSTIIAQNTTEKSSKAETVEQKTDGTNPIALKKKKVALSAKENTIVTTQQPEQKSASTAAPIPVTNNTQATKQAQPSNSSFKKNAKKVPANMSSRRIEKIDAKK